MSFEGSMHSKYSNPRAIPTLPRARFLSLPSENKDAEGIEAKLLKGPSAPIWPQNLFAVRIESKLLKG